MAQDPYGLLASGVDPETSIEMQKLMRQQKVAEAMGQSAMQPLQGQMVGNVYVAPSLTQGLAKLAQGYLSRKDQDATDASMRGLSQRYQQGQSDAMQRVIGAMTGTPESATGQMYPAGGNPDEQGGMGYQPSVPGGIDQAISVAGQSPYTRKIAEALMQKKMGSALDSADFKEALAASGMGAGGQQAVNPLLLSSNPTAQKVGAILQSTKDKKELKEEADARRAEEAVKESRRERENKEFLLRLGASLKQSTGAGVSKAPSGYRFTTEGDLEAIKGGPADVKAQILQQKEVDKAAGVDKQLDAIERNIDKIMTQEGETTSGLKSYVGQIDQYYPEWAMSSDTASAGSALKSLQEQMTMLNLAGAKSAVGQSFGSMQVKEWDKFMNLLTNISRGVPDSEMESNLKFIRNFVKDKRDVLRAAVYGGTYGIGAGKDQTVNATTASSREFKSEADAAAAGLKPGTRVIINGVQGTWQ